MKKLGIQNANLSGHPGSVILYFRLCYFVQISLLILYGIQSQLFVDWGRSFDFLMVAQMQLKKYCLILSSELEYNRESIAHKPGVI